MTKNCNTCDHIEFDYCHSSLRIAALNGVWNQKMAHDYVTGLNCSFWQQRSKNKQARLDLKNLYDVCSSCKKHSKFQNLNLMLKEVNFYVNYAK